MKTIYLTGAPAAGKSTTTRLLEDRVESLLIWEYGARLTAYIQEQSQGVLSQTDLRAQSATVITPNVVAAVDDLLLAFVECNRGRHHIIIDSHAVTKEGYGFRITPFSLTKFAKLAPDEVWVLTASPEITISRINEDRSGRRNITKEEAANHSILQCSVAATYAMAIGVPCYIFDTDGDRDELLSELQRRLS